MNIHSNETFKIIVSEIEALGGKYWVENGSKHCIVKYEVGDFKGQTVLSYGSTTSWRNSRNARSDIRRVLKRAGVLPPKGQTIEAPQEEAAVTEEITAVSTLQLSEHEIVEINGELRMRDIDVGDALGFTRVNNIRNLIESNRHELSMYGHLAEVEVRTSPEKGGRPGKSYLLNREQSLLVAMLSRTPRAAEVRYQVIKAYSDWDANHNPQPAPKVIEKIVEKPAQPEILANEAAIDMLIDRLATQVVGISATQTTTKVEFPSDLVTRKDFETVMMRYFEWMKGELRSVRMAQPSLSMTGLEGVVDKIVSQRIGQSNQAILADLQKRTADTDKLLSESLASVARSISAVQASQEKFSARMNDLNGSVPQEPQQEEAFEEESEDDVAAMPSQDPIRGDFGPLVAVSDVYRMAGLNPDSVGGKRSLSMSMRFSIEDYARRRKIKPTLFAFSGQYRQQWPTDMVAAWYKEKGRELLTRHMRAIA